MVTCNQNYNRCAFAQAKSFWARCASYKNDEASGKHTTLIDRDHVLDVNEGIFSAMNLEELQSVRDELSEVLALALRVIHLITKVCIVAQEDVENWKKLSVVWDKSLPNHFSAHEERLKKLDYGAHEFWVSCVQGCLHRHDQLWHHRQYLRTSLLQHVICPLHRQEAVRVFLFADAIEENW